MNASNLTVILFCALIQLIQAAYDPTWDSLDKRPLPRWYDDAKFGIFIHWGVFSVPSFGTEWFWNEWKGNNKPFVDFMKTNYPDRFTYQDFAKEFSAEFYDPNQWADIFAKSGAKYVVLTSKHHEGYTLWPSKYSYSWNAVDVGPGRNVLGDLATAVRAKNLTFGVYHSLYEWYNPIYASDKASQWKSREFVDNKILPEMKELVEAYHPSIVWSDGDWEAPDTYWKSTEFLAWLYNDSPVKDYVVVNDRWGKGTNCQHGDIYTCSDRYNPGTLQPHKWENAMTIDKASWGFRRNANIADYCSAIELLTQLVSTVSCGGNLLMNVGPTKEGTIAPIFQERLAEVGEWLAINGEAIYGSRPWTAQNDTMTYGVWYTKKDTTVYAISLHWTWDGSDGFMELASARDLFEKNPHTAVYMLGNESDGPLSWSLTDKSVKIKFPDMAIVKSRWAYTLKIVPMA
ncbi:unnamed protein product [Phyllotreta striolata]|uniref:Putative alpha-L-fucosidase n=1 Tax=Phyllotreta striolata TaxID=444603 RepID=A0A9N9XRX9_PHYSR|nr:unnamed protein product [Phyllotreta striolata]